MAGRGHDRKTTTVTTNGRSGLGNRLFEARRADGEVAPIAAVRGANDRTVEVDPELTFITAPGIACRPKAPSHSPAAIAGSVTSSRSALASLRSVVSNPSVNQP